MIRLRILTFVLLCFALNSCSTVYDITSFNRQRLLHLTVGMPYYEVERIMGTRVHTVYESQLPFPVFEQRSPESSDWYCVFYKSFITISNPYKSEVVEYNGKQYYVDYYVTGLLRPQAEVSTSELTPLIFVKDQASHERVAKYFELKDKENYILLGWGWDFLNELSGQ